MSDFIAKIKIAALWSFIALLGVCPVGAQELSVLGGAMHDYTNSYDRSYAWQVEYREGFGDYYAFSISYLNEGHLERHHRDGHAVQVWARAPLLDKRLVLSAGIGPFFYYDTTRATENADWSNEHAWGIIMSCDALWYLTDRWYVLVRSNWSQAISSYDTVSLLTGIGYRFDPLSKSLTTTGGSPPSRRIEPAKNEITLFLGRTIVNSFGSELANARSIEYRRRLFPYMDWTISWLNEGGNEVLRRNGIVSELWGVRSFFDDRFSIGIGGGVYLSINHQARQQDGEHDGCLSGIVTLSGNYKFFEHWGIRASWDRIVTTYDRDADVVLGGISYFF